MRGLLPPGWIGPDDCPETSAHASRAKTKATPDGRSFVFTLSPFHSFTLFLGCQAGVPSSHWLSVSCCRAVPSYRITKISP